jgi:hypothetical protein
MSNGEDHSVSKFAAVHGPQMQEQTNGHKLEEPIPYLISKDGSEHVVKFLYLEGVEYIMWNVMNNTCIHLRVNDSHIYMYRRERIYKELSEKIQ